MVSAWSDAVLNVGKAKPTDTWKKQRNKEKETTLETNSETIRTRFLSNAQIMLMAIRLSWYSLRVQA